MSLEQRRDVDQLVRLRPAAASGTQQTVEQQRTAFATLMSLMRMPDGTRTTATALADRPAVLVEPDGGAVAPRVGTLLYLHGGGFVVGSPHTSMCLTANLVVRTGLRAVSLDYRLAPEHPFPAAVDDCLAAYHALLDDGADPASVALAGDSAGGGLAVTTCLAARREGLPLPAVVVTFSAGLDSTRTGRSMDSKAGIDPFFTRASLDPTFERYLAGQDPEQELLSPATLADLTGFPPLLLQVGSNEVLLDDSTRLAERARDAGVDVVLDVTADVPHVFQAFAGFLDEADQALDRAALFLTQHLAG